MPNRHTVAREPRCAVRQEALILLLADREAEIRPVIAAPSPVERPQANRQARSSRASGFTFASAISGITVYSAKVEVPMKCRIGSPPA